MRVRIEVDLSAKEAQELIEGNLHALQKPVKEALSCAGQDELVEEFTEMWSQAKPVVNQSVSLYCQAMDEAMQMFSPNSVN
ncbi:hypothetical protein R50073_03000 [Maricurvus nonylphenolicus]|uniref:hypothetical protein n=1 Tax=Maricurvus nonylphenolicus TaxID=1008307 RepID=UPI0036F20D0F